MTKRRVLLSVPRWGVDPPESSEYRASVMFSLGKWSTDPACPFEFLIADVADMAVQFAREKICQTALAHGADFIAMMDDDMRGPLDIWPRLLAHDVDIVAPLAFTRSAPHMPVVYATRGGWHPSGTYVEKTTHFIRNYPKDQLFECDAVGFGAVLIKTDVLKKFGPPWFFTFDSTKGRSQTGEDISFCIEAGKKGCRVFCDSSVKLLHLGPRRWIGEEEYEKTTPDLAEIRETLGDWSREKSDENLVA